jgi:hypothetical protein
VECGRDTVEHHVRDGSTKQLASAVGEGAAAAIQIRGYLDRLDRRSMA